MYERRYYYISVKKHIWLSSPPPPPKKKKKKKLMVGNLGTIPADHIIRKLFSKWVYPLATANGLIQTETLVKFFNTNLKLKHTLTVANINFSLLTRICLLSGVTLISTSSSFKQMFNTTKGDWCRL